MRRKGGVGIRGAVVALLALSMAGLEIRGGEEPMSVMFLLDRSDSMAGASSFDRLNTSAIGARAGDRAGVIVFGANAVLERRLAAARPIGEIASDVGGSATNIEAALRLARASLAGDGTRRIVLISDGRETTGSARAEAARAASDGISIDVVDSEGSAPATRRPRIARVSAPASVRAGEPFLVLAEVDGPQRARVEVSLDRDGEPAIVREAVIPESGRAAVAFDDQHRTTGLHVYRAVARTVGEDDVIPDERAVGAVVSVAGTVNVLYVCESSGVLSPTLAANDFRVTHVRPAAVPGTAHAMAAYDAIVLDDVPPSSLDAAQATAIARHVEQRGGGLLVLGSERSLETGELTEGPLGPLLPVDLRPRSGRRSPALALVLLFDKSGSMADSVGGVPKIEIARQAVAKVLGVLPATDALGVIAFDAAPVAIVPLLPGHDARAMSARLRSVEAGGATRIAPAMQLAHDWLQGSTAAFAKRHVLLVSDGRTTAGDVARLEALLGASGFELSVVALGPESDRRLLTRLAGLTGGRAYFPADLSQLPLILAREASRVAGGRLVEERFAIRTSAHPAAAGLERYGVPQLRGYVVSASKPTAETILTSHLDDPILAAWRFGLGRAAVFTADLRGSWSAGMRSWNGFAPLWVQSMRWLSRASDSDGLRVGFEPAGNEMQVVVEAEDSGGGFLNSLSASVHTGTPADETLESTLKNVAPGRYMSSIPLKEPGAYAVTIAARDRQGTSEERLVRGFYWSADAEQLNQGTDVTALKLLADATGGTGTQGRAERVRREQGRHLRSGLAMADGDCAVAVRRRDRRATRVRALSAPR